MRRASFAWRAGGFQSFGGTAVSRSGGIPADCRASCPVCGLRALEFVCKRKKKGRTAANRFVLGLPPVREVAGMPNSTAWLRVRPLNSSVISGAFRAAVPSALPVAPCVARRLPSALSPLAFWRAPRALWGGVGARRCARPTVGACASGVRRGRRLRFGRSEDCPSARPGGRAPRLTWKTVEKIVYLRFCAVLFGGGQ